jgi:quinol monooxygenase YgiN
MNLRDEGPSMIIVAGWLRVEVPNRRDYLAGCREVVEAARRAEGCLDFALTADTVSSDRIYVYERWESPQALERFRGSGPDPDQAGQILEAQVQQFQILPVETA